MKLSHAEAQALISARLDGPLDPVAERELNAHLATCDSCRAFNASATQLARGLQSMPRLAASPAVNRAVIDHVSQPRSGWARFLGTMPENAMPVASAIAVAIVVLFVGAFGLMRLLDNDEPGMIPALTEPVSNLAQQAPATEPDGSEEVRLPAPTEDESGQLAITEEPAGNDVAGDEPTAMQATEPVESEPPVTEQGEEIGPPTQETSEETPAATTLMLPTDEPATGGSTTEGTGEPAAQPTDEPVLEEPATELTEEPVAGVTEAATGAPGDDEVTEIGPSGQSVVASTPDEAGAAWQPTEPPVDSSPTIEPTEEPSPTLEPSPTAEPTAEPSPTQEPTPTIEPTQEPTPVPSATATLAPSPETTPTPAITQREETLESSPVDNVAEGDDGTGAAATEDVSTNEPTQEQSISLIDDDDEQVIGPPDSTIEGAGPDDPAGNGGGQGGTDSMATSEAEDQQPGQTGTGSAAVSLGNAPVYLDLASVSGDPGASGARLGLDASGNLIYAVNPGRVPLTNGEVTVRQIDSALGPVVGACDGAGDCVDLSSGSKQSGGIDTPIGWLGDTVIYERLNGSDYIVEFRAITLDFNTRQPIDDWSLGGGDGDWETQVRPYPVGARLIVPAPGVWLAIDETSITALSANPAQWDISLIRIHPATGGISYVTGSTLVLASLDAPGVPMVEIPFAAADYDISPDGSMVAFLTGGGIEIRSLDGTVLTTIPNVEGIAVGSLTWLNEGIVYSDLSSGLLRIVEP